MSEGYREMLFGLSGLKQDQQAGTAVVLSFSLIRDVSGALIVSMDNGAQAMQLELREQDVERLRAALDRIQPAAIPPSEPTEWSFEPAPRVSGWFAVLRGWDPEEGLFPGATWATDGVFNDSGTGSDGSSGHAGPFPTEADALRWAEAHDPEGPL